MVSPDQLSELRLLATHRGAQSSGQRLLRFEAQGPDAPEIMSQLRASPPDELAGCVVVEMDDLLNGDGTAQTVDAVVLHLRYGRVVVRPGNDDATVLITADFWQPESSDSENEPVGTHGQLSAVLNALSSLLCDPERARAAVDLVADDPESAESLAAHAARATRLFAASPTTIERAAALRLVIESIDLTTLAGDDTIGRVRALCAQARQPDPIDASVGPTAAVCVYPNLVAIASELIAGSGVAVASVAGAFPSGLSSLEVRLSDIAEAVCAGADEIDVVLNRAAFLAGDYPTVTNELRAMRAQVGPRIMKVILETSELASPAAIAKAAQLAIDAGADWIKTSTGKSAAGATPIGVLTMAQAIDAHRQNGRQPVGVKISGGVRTAADALGYLAIVEAVLGEEWLHPSRVRFGASGLLTAVVEELRSL